MFIVNQEPGMEGQDTVIPELDQLFGKSSEEMIAAFEKGQETPPGAPASSPAAAPSAAPSGALPAPAESATPTTPPSATPPANPPATTTPAAAPSVPPAQPPASADQAAIEAARRETEAAQRTAQEAMAEVERLKAQLAAGTAQTPDQAAQAAELITKIDELIQGDAFGEMPELGALLGDMSAAMKAMSAQVKTLADGRAQDLATQQEQERHEQERVVAEAIAGNPHLTLWQRDDPAAWGAAVSIDKMLRAMPEWTGKPMTERFAKVAELTRAVVPTAKQVQQTIPAATGLTSEQLALLARQNLAAAAATANTPVPTSLSAIPSSGGPEQTELQQLDQMSATSVFEMVQSMTPAQRQSLYARI